MEELQYQLGLLEAKNHKLEDDERMYRMICGMSTNAFIYYNFSSDRLEVLGCWERFFSFQLTSIQDLHLIFDFVQDEDRHCIKNILYAEKSGAELVTKEYELTDRDVWIELESNIIYNSEKKPIEKIIRIRDITKYKKQNDEITYMAYYDMLTGLHNRNYFVSVLNEWIKEAEKEKALISVMCIDIDDFKKINDGQGMETGDELVQSFGIFLKEFEHKNVIASHVNNDVFYIAIYEPVEIRCAQNIYEQIQTRLESPFRLLAGDIYFTVSVGVAEYPEASTKVLDLLNCAEIVMYKAKISGKNSICYFEKPILEDFKDTIQIENQLKRAVLDNNFELFYQPQYDSKTQKLRGVEALIRWWDEEGHMVSPGIFIPIAEKTDMIVSIGDWVLEEGIRRYASWRKKFNYSLVLSLNISSIQYKKKNFVQNLLGILKKYDVDPSNIELEITESILIDEFEEVVKKLRVLKDYGIKISLDDFGTGYSSLAYLKGLPIDTLKIDKSFIDTVTADNSTRVITESIVSMVKKLGYETVAEGVETEEQFEYLKEIDCDNIQGFLLGRPMPAKDIEILIASSLRKMDA